MSENPWLMRVESGLAAHFKQSDGSSRPGVMWSIGLTRDGDSHSVMVRALLADDASAATRKDEAYQARTAMQYLDARLRQGWHPREPCEHTIYIGNPHQAEAATAAHADAIPSADAGSHWWKFW